MGLACQHDFDVIIEDSDIDFLGHVNNAVYLKWIQAAVLEHWHRVATPDAAALHHWIAVKHEIIYRRPAFLHDRIVVSVTLDRVQRESAFYESAIRRGSDLIAEVKSRWCCIDAAQRLPVRVSDDIVRCFLPADRVEGARGRMAGG